MLVVVCVAPVTDWRRLAYALLAGAALGAGLVLWLRKPQTTERVEYRDREVVKWRTTTQTQLRYAGAPGSTTIISPDGTVTIYGPAGLSVTQSATGEGTRETVREIVREVRVARSYDWLVGLGADAHAGLPLSAGWQAFLGHRAGRLLFADLGVVLTAQGGLTSWAPDRVGLAVIATW